MGVGGTNYLMSVYVLVFVLLAMLQLRRFMELFPLLMDSVFRARGSSTLESSVNYSADRTHISLTLIIPAVIMIYRYCLWDASFLHGLGPGLRLAAVTGIFGIYVLLRLLMYLLFKPRRGGEFYQRSHRACFTFFILLMLAVMFSVGVLYVFHAGDVAIRHTIYTETALFYSWFLLRRTQFLSLSCNHLQTFLYLCGLEILPTGLLVATAVIL